MIGLVTTPMPACRAISPIRGPLPSDRRRADSPVSIRIVPSGRIVTPCSAISRNSGRVAASPNAVRIKGAPSSTVLENDPAMPTTACPSSGWPKKIRAISIDRRNIAVTPP
jgi:hypothetical protein